MHHTYFLAALRPHLAGAKQAHLRPLKRPGKARDNVGR